jgi:hypothetical protein
MMHGMNDSDEDEMMNDYDDDVMYDAARVPADEAGARGALESSRKGKGLRRMARLSVAILVGTLTYAFAIRPWHVRWGTAGDEATRVLPGDELLDRTFVQTTRAITISAPPSAIWPWLVQMGQGRGGLYSYDWLENLVGCDIHSADTIMPELQRLAVGDTIRLGPAGYPSFIVAAIEPEHAIVLASPNLAGRSAIASANEAEHASAATWAFVLEPVDPHTTRLIVRLRGDWESTVAMMLINRLLVEPAQFVMERKMIHGIKERAERRRR